MPKVKLVDSKCITKGVLSVLFIAILFIAILFIAIFANNLEDCFGKKEIVSDLSVYVRRIMGLYCRGDGLGGGMILAVSIFFIFFYVALMLPKYSLQKLLMWS